MRFAEFENETRSSLVPLAESLVLAKLSAMAVLGLSSFLLGVLPLKLASCLRWKEPAPRAHSAQQPLLISLLLCFGGGVLLYTTFMHLQPEVRVGMSAVLNSGVIPAVIADSGLNLAELIFCIGFFFVYLIEEVVHCLLDKTSREDDEEVLHRTLSVRRCRGNLIPRINLNKPTPSPPSTITASTQILIRDYKKTAPLDPVMTVEPSVASEASTSSEPVSIVKSFRGLLAVVALSFHAVFEGLAVGLEKNAANVWYLCAAIATHKLVIAFCIGVELVSSRTKSCLVLFYIATFALVSPLGIGIGLALSVDESENPVLALASVVLQGMAAGTLLYVVFFEVLQREKAHARYGLAQLLSIMAGFVVMVALGLFIGHEHAHFEDHDHDHGYEHEHR